jgi:hypothetical protein
MEAIMERTGRKKFFAGTALLLAIVFFAWAKEKPVQSIWVSSPAAMDGLIDEWEGDAFNMEKKVKVEYAFRNDADTLYVFFKFNDSKYLSSIDITGMTLWVDPAEKKDKGVGINFTKKRISADEYIAILERQQGPLSEAQKEGVRASEFYFISQAQAVDKKGNPLEREAASDAAKGAAYNVSVGQDAVTYEFKVPFKNLTAARSGTEIQPGEVVGIGFEWGGLTDKMREEFMKGGAGGDSGAMGISDGRGGGGAESVGFDGASPEGLTALRKMTKKYSFWTAVQLAKGQ